MGEDEAVDFIHRHKAEPFFLHLTYNAPHTPLQAPEEEVRPFVETGQFTKAVSTIYGMIHRMDSGVARVLDALRQHCLEQNTILLFTSDDGPQFGGEGEHCTTRFNCQFNGAKGIVYEGGIRVHRRGGAELPGRLRGVRGETQGSHSVLEVPETPEGAGRCLHQASCDRPGPDPANQPLQGAGGGAGERGDSDPWTELETSTPKSSSDLEAG